MTQDWLQRTADVSGAVDDLLARYGEEQIDSITSSDQYELAKATLALALNDGLNAAGGTSRKRRRAAGPLFDKMLNGLAVIFMLGYDQAKRESGDAQ
jgi:hypothetical protein